MAVQLTVTIDKQNKSALFSGAGTFMAKERIKALGPARWVATSKSWEVKPCELSKEEISKLFPGIEIKEGAHESILNDDSQVAVSSPDPALQGLPSSYGISELLSRIRFALQQAFPAKVYVRGRISSIKDYSGRVYMELTDLEQKDERISCIIWRDAAKVCAPLLAAGFKLEVDLQVMFEGKVEVSRKDGRFSFIVTGVVAEYTVAKLAAERELTNQRLKAEGLFDRNKKLSLPFLPVRLGVLTSSGGTVINDFLAALGEAKFGFELIWLSVSVQGSSAKQEIVSGISKLSGLKNLDALLIFRGGGSPAELAVFNSYEVARAICMCKLPVVSAIGHQEDQSSAQDVSCIALGVPKDIGHFFSNLVVDKKAEFARFLNVIVTATTHRVSSLDRELVLYAHNIRHALEMFISSREQAFRQLQQGIPYGLRSFLSHVEERLRGLTVPIRSLAGQQLSRMDERMVILGRLVCREFAVLIEKFDLRLKSMEQLVEGISPEVQLRRGFSLVWRKGADSLVTSREKLVSKEEIEIQFHDGVADAIVK